MSRFKIRVRVQALEVDIDGSRDDMPVIASNVGRQFAGLIEPAALVAEGVVESSGDNDSVGVAVVNTPVSRSRPARKLKRAVPARATSNGAGEVTWKHDPSKWGSPQQGWSASDKAIWFLYVSGEEIQVKDLTSSALASGFNRMFREAGTIRAGNLPRDLGRLKTQAPAVIGEDTTKTPPTWFLTTEGTKKAEELVKQARGQSPSGH